MREKGRRNERVPARRASERTVYLDGRSARVLCFDEQLIRAVPCRVVSCRVVSCRFALTRTVSRPFSSFRVLRLFGLDASSTYVIANGGKSKVATLVTAYLGCYNYCRRCCWYCCILLAEGRDGGSLRGVRGTPSGFLRDRTRLVERYSGARFSFVPR